MLILISLLFLRSPTVADLTKDTFFAFTSNDQCISVIHFYGKNCPACVDAEDTFEELSRMYWQEPRVRFGQLDCDRYSDVCDSTGAVDRPAWLAWMPSQTHSKRYNRNINEEQFEKWIRQQTGIWPTAKPNNLLYINSSLLTSLIKKKTNCLYTIIDTPRMDESQPLHNASRTLEKKVRKGARFFAVNVGESPEIAKKLFKNEKQPKFGAFLYNKGTWSQYKGENDPESIAAFLKEKKCNLVIATPTPTPVPLEELEDVPDDEYIPFDETDENDKQETGDENDNHGNNEDGNEEHQNSEESDWSDDEM